MLASVVRSWAYRGGWVDVWFCGMAWSLVGRDGLRDGWVVVRVDGRVDRWKEVRDSNG